MIPGSGDRPGDGVRRHVYEVSRRLGQRGYNVVCLLPSYGPSRSIQRVDASYNLLKVSSLSFLNTQVRIDKINGPLMAALEYASYSWITRKICQSITNQSIIHSHGFYTVAQPSKSQKNIKRVSTLHGSVPTDWATKKKSPTAGLLLNKFLADSYKKADLWTAISQRVKDIILDLYDLDAEKITVTPHGVDARFFSGSIGSDEISRLETKFALDRPVRVLFLGQLDKAKRPDILLQAIKLIKEKRKDVMLVIRSSMGDYYQETMDLIRTLDLASNVRVIRQSVYGSELRALYRSSTTFISTHQIVGPSTALMEAMASGVPPIIGNDSNSSIVDNSCGIILNTLNPQSLANAIEKIADDAQLARKMGQNGIRKMEREYDWDNVVVPSYISVYQRLYE